MVDVPADGIQMNVRVTPQNFEETDYLLANLDVSEAVAQQRLPSGRFHFAYYGRAEGRTMRNSSAIAAVQARKLERIAPILRDDLPFRRRGAKYDFLTPELVAETAIAETNAVSSNEYDGFAQEIIAACPGGLVLDCGAGKRPVYYSNVINYEIVDYDTTDVIGVGEVLPFRDDSVDAVISVAVLEHVRDPFACAAEIVRVLKPGGRLMCCVPFLQPEHGYPHHYFNMAPQGLRSLFERRLHIDDHKVLASTLPVFSLTWILKSWAAGLEGDAAREFAALGVGELIAADPVALLDKPWVRQLQERQNFELASATVLFAHKPDGLLKKVV